MFMAKTRNIKTKTICDRRRYLIHNSLVLFAQQSIETTANAIAIEDGRKRC